MNIKKIIKEKMKKLTSLNILFSSVLILLLAATVQAETRQRGSKFNEGDIKMQKYSIEFTEVDQTPASPASDRLKIYAKDSSGTTKLYTLDSLGSEVELGAGGGGGGGSGDITDVWGCSIGNCNVLTASSGDTLDAGSATSISPAVRSSSLPGTCTEGNFYQDTDSGGSEVYVCTATNTWTKFAVTTDNVSTATALAANGSNCSAGQFPLGVDASGAVETCTALPTTITGTANQITASGSTGAITLSLPATINVATSGNAATATALASNPSDCSSNQFATTIAASGNLTCAQPAFSDLSGSATDAQIPNTITVDSATTATTATALVANGTNCSAGSYPLGVDASGNAESCTAAGAGSGDISDVGDCSTGACFTDASGTGTQLFLKNATSGSVTLKTVTGALGTRTISFPAETGTACTTGSVCSGYQAGPLSSDVVTSGSTATIQSDAVALGTDTTGNYVATESEGLGIDISGSGSESATTTIAFDPTEITGSRTWGDASTNTIVWSFDRLSGTDPTLTFNSGDIQTNSSITLGGSTGVRETAATGVLTLASVGNTNNENLILNLEATSNAVALSSGTGVSSFDFGSINVDLDSATTTLSVLAGTIDAGGATSFEIPNGASVTTNTFGQIAADNNAWASGRGAVQFFDGTANTYLVGVLASDTPLNGQVLKWNSDGTITWETNSPTISGAATSVVFLTTTDTPGVDAGLTYNSTTDALTSGSFLSTSTSAGYIQLFEASGNGTNFIALSSAASRSGDSTITIDGTDATTITFPTTSQTLVGKTSTDTLTNKWIQPRTNTVASSATPSINTDTTDEFTITALAAAITSMTTNLSGTPVNGQKLTVRILDNGTARAITWGASFASRGATLPTTTVLSKYMYVGLIWNSTTSTWDCVAVVNES